LHTTQVYQDVVFTRLTSGSNVVDAKFCNGDVGQIFKVTPIAYLE
jgi:hypothetical protein